MPKVRSWLNVPAGWPVLILDRIMTDWPDDLATALTPVARDAAEVREVAATAGTLPELTARQSVCRACPRLVAWREDVAAVRRKSFRDQPYWGRPVAGWGDPEPAILILGL